MIAVMDKINFFVRFLLVLIFTSLLIIAINSPIIIQN